MNEVKDTYEIDIVRLIRSMVKNWWVMLIPALIIALLVYSYIFLYIPDQYRVTVPVYIKTDKGASSGYTELTTARETVEDYNILLKNNETAAMILRDLESEGGLNGSYTASQISNMLSVSHKSGSSWIGISVTCKDSLDASRILNMAIQVLKRLS
ncbi:MAG: hypothetical protein IIX15_02770, partial [Clostridia bacterium]|nr:hypothetical protein [Clostridia bacterium]